MLPHRLLALALCASLPALALAEAPVRKDLLGDPLPEGAICRMGTGRLRASSIVTCLAFTPDGKTLVSAGHGNKLTFWSVSTGQIEKEWAVANSTVTALHFDKSGKTLAVGCLDGTVRILDGTTGTERRRLADPNNRRGGSPIGLSPDGRWLAMGNGSGSEVLLFNVDTGVLAYRFPGANLRNRPPVVFTPDSKHFVSLWTDYKLHLIDVATGKSVRLLETGAGQVAIRSNVRVTAMTLSADGKKLVYLTFVDRLFRFVEVGTGREIKRLERTIGPLHSTIGFLDLSPNGSFVVEGNGDASIRVWGVASGKLLREFTAPNTALNFSTLSPDRRLVAAASNTSIFLWDIASGKQLHGGVGHASVVVRLVLSPDGKRLVSAGSGTIRVWDAATGKQETATRSILIGHTSSYFAVASDNKSARWIGFDRAVYRWQFDAERPPSRLTSPRAVNVNYHSRATSPDGKLFATAAVPEGRVKLLDNLGKAPDRELGTLPVKYAASFQFSPDGRTLAVGAGDRSVSFYDVATGEEMRKFVPDPSRPDRAQPLIEFSPDGRTRFQYDGQTHIVETITGGVRVSIPQDTSGRPTEVAWSADGRLVARGFADGLAVVTDLWTGREVFRRQTGQGRIQALCLSRDDKRLATGGTNTTAVVWELLPLERPSGVASKGRDAWADLADADASIAHRAMLHLIASPDDTARLFAKRLVPPPPIDAGHIDRLVAALNDDKFEVRERASLQLFELGTLARDALKKASRSSSLEVKRRATDLLRRIEPGAGISPERLRCLRAIEVLERINTPAARAVLETMLKAKLDASLEASIRDALARGK